MSIFEMTIFWISIKASFYWLMYALWFILWNIILYKRNVIPRKYLDDLFLYIFLGMMIWARLWYVLFYNFEKYLVSPIDILKVWEWWMSFHWWVIWVVIAMFLFSKKFKFSFLKLADQVTLVLPIGIWLWRFWNYLNKELLWYSGYTWIWAIEINWISYFPSPLLECLLEGICLFIILNFIYIKCKNIKTWQIAALFLIFYSIFRIFIEIFFRTPDQNIWYILNYFTMGEILSLPMFLIWVYYFIKLRKNAL